jgi:hypothetical protein
MQQTNQTQTTISPLFYNSKISSSENRDCTVRAMARAFDIHYDIAHKICEKHGRISKKGWEPRRLFKVKNGKRIPRTIAGRVIRFKQPNRSMTIQTFLKRKPIGRYYCVKTGHAFAIIDGVVYGQQSDNSRIVYYITVKIKNNDK